MFIPYIAGKPTRNIILYYVHAEPADPVWTPVSADGVLTVHGGHGIGAPHLHHESAVTPRLGRALIAAGMLDENPVAPDHWQRRAAEAGIDVPRASDRVEKQLVRDGLLSVHRTHIVVGGGYPKYKRSRLSDVGYGETWIIDIAQVAGRA